MNVWDKALPHRKLINRSLKKSTDKLRSDIDTYKLQYDEQNEKIKCELEQTKADYDRQYEDAKNEIYKLLSTSVEELQSLGSIACQYISKYFERQLTYKKMEQNKLQQRVTKEYVTFLSEYMKQIGIEIEHLKKRNELLSEKANINDIVQLISLSGDVLPVRKYASSQELWRYVDEEISKSNGVNDAVRSALINVRSILEERLSYSAEVQYISWVIEQKIQLSKELKYMREKQRQVLDELQISSNQFRKDCEGLNNDIESKTMEIRFYRARAIVYASIDITDLGNKKRYKEEMRKGKKEERKAVIAQIKGMKVTRSSDDWKWNRLQTDWKSLQDEIERLSMEIKEIETELSDKKNKRNAFEREFEDCLVILSQHLGVSICTDRSNNELYAYVNKRLKELETIEEAGKTAAQDAYRIELDRLKEEKKTEMDKADGNIKSLQEQLQEREDEDQIAKFRLQGELAHAMEREKEYLNEIKEAMDLENSECRRLSQQLAGLRKNDQRFPILRLFFETPEIKQTKQAIEEKKQEIESREKELSTAEEKIKEARFNDDCDVQLAQKNADSAMNRKKQAEEALREAEAERERIEKKYDTLIKQTKPHQERPTVDEQLEMQKLKKWKEQQTARKYKR